MEDLEYKIEQIIGDTVSGVTVLTSKQVRQVKQLLELVEEEKKKAFDEGYNADR